jgi:hypothetical protein
MVNVQIINGRKVQLFDSMYDYVNDADFGNYEIQDGKERNAPFVEAVKPVENSDFMVWHEDSLVYDGLTYIRVNFGEDDDPEEYGNCFLLESELYDAVYLIYRNKTEELVWSDGERTTNNLYGADATCYRTVELARLQIEE